MKYLEEIDQFLDPYRVSTLITCFLWKSPKFLGKSWIFSTSPLLQHVWNLFPLNASIFISWLHQFAHSGLPPKSHSLRAPLGAKPCTSLAGCTTFQETASFLSHCAWITTLYSVQILCQSLSHIFSFSVTFCLSSETFISPFPCQF